MSEEVVTPKILGINNVDFSSYVNQRSWKVQKSNEYASWVDGNRISRRTIVRTRISGAFTLTFLSATALSSFTTAVAAATATDGYTTVKVYVNNENQLEEINAFLTTSTKTVWTQDANQNPAVFQVSVNLEQR